MRILHTGDWHLGKRLGNFNRIEEQRQVLDEIVQIADSENIDVVLVAGDLFDSFNPTVEATELLYFTLKKLTNNGCRPVIAIAGNHDSPDRIEAPDPLAKACGIIFAGYPHSEISSMPDEVKFQIVNAAPGFVEIKLPNYSYALRILLTPYANEFRLKTYLGSENEDDHLNEILHTQWQNLAEKYCDEKGINILLAHLFMMQKGTTPPEEPDDERPINIGTAAAVFSENIPSQIQYTALGHLHRGHTVKGADGMVNYSGSPLSYSFAEAGQQKFVRILDIEPNKPVNVKDVALQSGRILHRKKFDDVALAVQWLKENPNTLVELTIQSETYLTAENRKALNTAHDGIIMIIPEITDENASPSQRQNINLNEDITELFKQFFYSKKGQVPSDELLELFKEIKH